MLTTFQTTMPNLYKDLRKPAKQAWRGSEDDLQTKCAGFLKKALFEAGLPQVFYHPPNGGRRSQREAARFKMMGVKPGVSDVVLPLKSGEFCGVYCELKKAGGSIKPEQKTFLNAVAAEGYLAVVVNDLETFQAVFTAYLNDRK